MTTDATRYPILVDTDALIAIANSPLWDEITAHIGLTATNVCQHELKRHREIHSPHAPEGSRPYRLHHGSATVLTALEDDETPLTISLTRFCEACADLLQSEGWTGYQAVEAAWEGLPVDCSDVIGSALQP